MVFSPDSHSSDADLLRESQAGDDHATEVILAKHLPGLRAYVQLHMNPVLRARESASDLVQSACRELIRSGESFEFQGEAELRTWLLTTVRNKILEKTRYHCAQKRAVEQTTALDESVPGPSALCSPSHHAIAREQVELLERALAELPDDWREAVVLSRVVGLDAAGIAERVGRSEAGVRAMLHRALSRLAREMERLEGR